MFQLNASALVATKFPEYPKNNPKEANEIKIFIQNTPNGLRLHEGSKIEIISQEFIQFVLKTFRDFTKQLFLTINESLQVQK